LNPSNSSLRPCPVPDEFAGALRIAGERLGNFGRPLFWYNEVGSTNDVAAALAAAGATSGTVVLSDFQRTGRGRQGRIWSSPAGVGLYASVVLRPEATVQPLLMIGAGLALAEGVRLASGLGVRLKWPNDLMVGDRKLAGVIAESCLQPEGAVPVIVLGFGVNVRSASHPGTISSLATSLEEELGRPVDRGLLLIECLVALNTRYQDLQAGRSAAVLKSWRKRAEFNRPVEWEEAGQIRHGVAEAVDESGALVIRARDGLVHVTAGGVRWVR
jgi:BirA family biotin operon repressor/biotin-[acetyl-CoA-carboxylase] ligase